MSDKAPRLSKRLLAIRDMIPECDLFTDIGCDHGYLPIDLLLKDRCKRAVAADIRQGPLDSARTNAGEYGIDKERISFILSAGLHSIDAPEKGYNVLCIAGMGGLNIAGILKDDRDKARCYDVLYLSPQSKQEELRGYLVSNGYRIDDERYLVDEDKLYVTMKVLHGRSEKYSDKELLLGAFTDKAVTDPEVREAFILRHEELRTLLEGDGIPEDRKDIIKKQENIYREVLKL